MPETGDGAGRRNALNSEHHGARAHRSRALPEDVVQMLDIPLHGQASSIHGVAMAR